MILCTCGLAQSLYDSDFMSDDTMQEARFTNYLDVKKTIQALNITLPNDDWSGD